MTFTELELLLGCAVGILLWHIGNQNKLIRLQVQEHDKLAGFLIKIGDGKGRIVKENDSYLFKEINNETKSISGI